MTIQVLESNRLNDKEEIYRFLYHVWSEEAAGYIHGMDHERQWVRDELDEVAHHFVALNEDGRIVGCVRANILHTTNLPEHLERSLQVRELGSLFGFDKICYASHFAIDPHERGKTVSSLLIRDLYNYSLASEVLIGLSYCALSYVNFYYQLGYRPYTKNFRLETGVRVPLLHCLRDNRYLKGIASPLIRFSENIVDDGGEVAQKVRQHFPLFRDPVFCRNKTHQLWAVLAHISPSGTDPYQTHDGFLKDLSEEEQRIVGQRLAEMTFQQDEYVFMRGEKEKTMGLLIQGKLGLEVVQNGIPRIMNILEPGEIFGEIGAFNSQGKATGLIALETSLVLLFPFDFLDRISRTDMSLAYKLSRKLLRTISSRFAGLTDVFADTPVPSLQSHRQPGSPGDSGNSGNSGTSMAIKDRVESYRFESLTDRKGELSRLCSQASIVEKMELSLLEKIGMRDGAKVLDLGSGPGVTSCLVARHFPACHVTGIEPDDELRELAWSLVKKQNLESRCRMIKGVGDDLPLEDGVMDFSYARLLFQHLPNPMAILKEMRRVTRSGGRIAIVDVDDRFNIVYPIPHEFMELENRIGRAQAAAGGDRNIGRKLFSYLHEIGLEDIHVEIVPFTAEKLGRKTYFNIVYSFKRQVLERAGQLDEWAETLFQTLEKNLEKPGTFAATSVIAVYGSVP